MGRERAKGTREGGQWGKENALLVFSFFPLCLINFTYWKLLRTLNYAQKVTSRDTTSLHISEEKRLIGFCALAPRKRRD